MQRNVEKEMKHEKERVLDKAWESLTRMTKNTRRKLQFVHCDATLCAHDSKYIPVI